MLIQHMLSDKFNYGCLCIYYIRMCTPLDLSPPPSVHMSICLSVCLSVYLSIRLQVYLSVFF